MNEPDGGPRLSLADARRILEAYDAEGSERAAARALGVPKSTFRGNLLRARAYKAGGILDGGLDGERPTAASIPRAAKPIGEWIEDRCDDFSRRFAAYNAARWLPVHVPVRGPFAIGFVGDPHGDDDGTNWPLLRRHMSLLAETTALYAINIGDTLNNWPNSGRLAKLWGDQTTTRSRAHEFAEHFYCNAGIKWLALLLGNHDLWNESADLLRKLSGRQVAPMFEWGAKLEIVPSEGQSVRVWAAHDFRGSSVYHTIQGLLRAARFKEAADIYAAGHIHTWATYAEHDADRNRPLTLLRARGYKWIDAHADQLQFPNQASGATVTTIIDPDADEPDARILVVPNLDLAVELLRALRRARGFRNGER